MIQIDKLLHLLAGYIVADAAADMLLVCGAAHAAVIGLAIGVLVVLAKDIVWDKILGRGTFEWLDIGYGLIGALIAFILNLINL